MKHIYIRIPERKWSIDLKKLLSNSCIGTCLLKPNVATPLDACLIYVVCLSWCSTHIVLGFCFFSSSGCQFQAQIQILRYGGGRTSWRGVWGPLRSPIRSKAAPGEGTGGLPPESSWELENIGPLF
jgi:hypothetical protein